MPNSLLGPELVTEHEFGHQYWYGMVGSNEFEDAWLDEGINSYTEVKVMDALYGRDTSVLNGRIGHAGNRDLQRGQYMYRPDTDPLSRNAWQFGSYGAYGGMTYGKTAIMLVTLESIVGEETLRKALNVYFMRYRFKHPTEQDFLNTVNEVAGQDLTWYWQQAVYGTEVFDYRVMQASSDRTDWFGKDLPKEKKGETSYHSQVLIHRKGTFIFPVTLEVKFDNGETVREQWDGRDRWKKFEWIKKAKIVSAEIDPDHKVMLDINAFNNSYVEQPQKATPKIMAYWLVVCQWLGEMLSWLA
jgi:aminopeptidase N